VELLLDKGANINARGYNKNTPLRYAQEKGNSEIVELLKQQGAKE